MPRIGIVTCRKVASLTPSERALIPLFEEKSFKTDILVWNNPLVPWHEYDCLIFRSIWDYHKHPQDFSAWLDRLVRERVKTLNAIKVVKANQHKFYLKDLEEKQIRIVPTLFLEKSFHLDLSAVRERGWRQAVIKPAVSASAYMTEVFAFGEIGVIEKKYRSVAQQADLLVQEFMPEIRTSGELSLVFFNRVYSHTVLKTTGNEDFRVQSEFGGQQQAYHPGKEIIETAGQILAQFQGDILYARIDGILKDGGFILMEIELIEPDLFFDYHQPSRDRFVEAAVEMICK